MTSWTAIMLAAIPCLLASSLIPAPAAAAAPTPMSWPTDGWQTSTPEQEGMDSGALARLVESVGSYPHDSLLVVRHGKIVLETAYAPYETDIRHDLRSVTKSIVGTLVGIMVQKGLLDSVDHPILELFADKSVANIDDDKRAITIQSLLDMASGIEWQEKAYTPEESISRMYRSPDRAAFVLDQPMSDRPGSRFQYNGGNPYVLSALITKKTGLSAFDFAKHELFGPLGITDVRWGRVDAQGVSDGESGVYMLPRDMAKIGLLYLHDGVWDGRTIFPASWVARIRDGGVEASDGFHYANFWWSLPERGAFMALGRHSQVILVLPKLDMVVVLTGSVPDGEFYSKARLVEAVAGAAASVDPLPADPVAASLLAAAVRNARTGHPYAVGLASDLARVVSDKVIRFADNSLDVKAFTLDLDPAQPSWMITTRRANEPEEQFSGPLGLDGIFRTSAPTGFGISAARGRWLGERTFELERRILGHSETQRWTFTFRGRSVDLVFDNTDGRRSDLRGEMSE